MNLGRIKEIFDMLIDNVLAILFTLMIVSAFLQVVIRFSPYSFLGTEEMARTAFIFVTYLGAAVAIRKKDHLVVTTIVNRLNRKTQIRIELILNLLIFIFVCIVMYSSFDMMGRTWTSPSGALSEYGITIGHRYIGVTAGLGLLLFYIILDSRELIKVIKGEKLKKDLRVSDDRIK